MARLLILLLALVGFAAPARADDIAAVSRSVVRVAVGQVTEDGVSILGHGTGFAVGRNRIVTNAHVVAMAVSNPDTVRLGIVPSEGSPPSPARIVLVDPARDLALLEMTEGELPMVTLFTGQLDPGQAVAALGYPGNVDLATAQSAEDLLQPRPPSRSMGNFSDVRQTNSGPTLVHTADIARGNSGGPLVDACGRVIGVNVAITNNEMGDSTFGFAIPVAALVEFLQEARQPVRSVTTECVSSEARQREEAEQAERDRQAREADESSRTRAAQERRAEQLAAIAERRETALYIAIVLLVLSVGAMGGAGILVLKNKPKPAIAAGAGAAILLIASAIVFLTRPSLSGAGEQDEQPDARTEASNRYTGENICRLDRQRSRVTVSNDEQVPLTWRDTGCVNESTQ